MVPANERYIARVNGLADDRAVIRWRTDGAITFLNEVAKKNPPQADARGAKKRWEAWIGTCRAKILAALEDDYYYGARAEFRRGKRRERPYVETIRWDTRDGAVEMITVAYLGGTPDFLQRGAEVPFDDERFRTLYDVMRDGFGSIDLSGKIRVWNDAFRRMLGYDDEEMLGLDFRAITPENYRVLEDRLALEQILPYGQSELYEKQLIRKDGSRVYVELRSIMARDADGRPRAYWGVTRDVTAKKRRERYDAIRNKLTRALAAAEESGDAFDAIVERAVEFDGVVGALAYRYDERSRRFRLEAKAGLQESTAEAGAFLDEEFPPSEASDLPLEEFPREVRLELIREGVRRVRCLPFYVAERLDAFIALGLSNDALSSEASDTLAEIEAPISDALRRLSEAETLRDVKRRFDIASDVGGVVVWEFVYGRGELYVTDNLIRSLGYDAERTPINWDSVAAMAHAEGLDGALKLMKEELKADKPFFEREVRLKTRDGGFRWYLARGAAVKDRLGAFYSSYGTAVDVTELKRAKSALAVSERHFRSFLDVFPDRMFRISRDGVYLDAFSQANDFPIPLEEIVGRNINEVIPESWRQRFLTLVRDVIDDGKLRTIEYEMPEFEPGAFEARLGRVNENECLVLVREITQRVEIERALKRGEERARIVSELISDFIYAFRLDETGEPILEWKTGSFEKIIGEVPDGKRKYSDFERWLAPGQEEKLRTRRERLARGETASDEFEVIASDGQRKTIVFYSSPTIDADTGETTGFVGAAQDITKLRATERELRESERKFIDAMKIAGRVVYEYDFANDRTEYGGAVYQYLERAPGQAAPVTREDMLKALHPDDAEGFARMGEKIFAGENRFDLTYRIRRADGYYARVRDVATVLRDDAGEPAKLFGVVDVLDEKIEG